MNKLIYAMAASLVICMSITAYSEGKSDDKSSWWCIMNPPLCFSADANGKTYDMINEKPEVSFKIVEEINKLRKTIKEKR